MSAPNTAGKPPAENAARHLSMHDPLTGLPNLELFADRLMMAGSLARRNEWLLAVLYVRLDPLPRFAEAHGKAAGDRALQAVASRLTARARGGDTVSRIDDDAILYLLVNPGNRENIRRIAQRIRDRLAQPFAIDSEELVIAPRIGIAVFPDDATAIGTLVDNARAAMRRSESRRLSYMFFETDGEPAAATNDVGGR